LRHVRSACGSPVDSRRAGASEIEGRALLPLGTEFWRGFPIGAGILPPRVLRIDIFLWSVAGIEAVAVYNAAFRLEALRLFRPL
jgi:hypothetical protein